MAYSVEWNARAADTPAELWATCFPPPAEGRWWFDALDRSGLQDQFTFKYGLVRSSNDFIGIVPAFIMNVPMDLVAPPEVMIWIRRLGPLGRPLLFQRTLFIGNVAGEGHTLGVRSGAQVDLDAYLTAVNDAAWQLRRREGAKLVVWKDMTVAASTAMARAMQRLGYFRIPSYPATRVLFDPSKGAEGYIAALATDYRYKLRKKLKASAKTGPMEVAVVEKPAPAELAEIWGLFWQTYEKGTTKFERFNPQVFDRFAEHADTRWLTLRRPARDVGHGGSLVAFMLLTRESGDIWVNRFIGIDYAAPKDWFLYYRLFVEAVDFCCHQGGRELLSGQTGYRPKVELGHDLLPQDNFSKHRNPLMHRVYAAIARGIDWAGLDADLKLRLEAHPEADISKTHWNAGASQ